MSTSSTTTTTVAPPSTVTAAYWLYIVWAILGAVGIIVSFIALPAALEAGSEAAKNITSSNGVDVAAVASGSTIGVTVFAAVLSVVFAILAIVFAVKMRHGKNWARIVLAIFAGVNVFGAFTGSYGVGLVHFLVGVVAAILTFVPASNAWFAAVKAQRETV